MTVDRIDLQRQLFALDEKYEQITGHNALLYIEAGGVLAEYHFTEGRVMYGVRSALAHMKTLTHNLAEEMTKEGQA